MRMKGKDTKGGETASAGLRGLGSVNGPDQVVTGRVRALS